MLPKNINPLISEVKEYLKDLLPLLSKKGVPYESDEALLKSITDKFMSYDIIRANYTDEDIDLLLTQSIIFKEASFEITDKYTEELVKSFFEKISEDYVYVPIELLDFPSEYKIGTCVIITSDKLPQGIKDNILLMEKQAQADDGTILCEVVQTKSFLPTYWIYTKLDSVGQLKQQEEMNDKIDHALSILRIASVVTWFFSSIVY